MVDGTQVEFQHAVLTIGVGYQGGSFQPYRNTIYTVTKSGNDERRNDAFFTFNPAPSGEVCKQWFMEGFIGSVYPARGSPEPVPRQMTASCPGGGLVFKVNQTSAFFIYGVVYIKHQWKIVTLRPGLNGESSKTTRYNDFSTVLDFGQILYWESGLERDQEYQVEIVIEGIGENYMSFHTLQLIDGGPKPSKSSGASSSDSPTMAYKPSSSGGLGTGPIAGIVVSVLFAAVAVLLAVYFIRRRRRLNDTVTRSTGNAPEFRQLTPAPASVPLRENDAGPAFLPPEYNEAWAQGSLAVNSSEPSSSRTVRSLPTPPWSRKQYKISQGLHSFQ